MIAADKEALQSQLKRRALQIRSKELDFFTVNFESVGTQSALLAGFAFQALTSVNRDDEAHPVPHVLFFITTTLAMCCNLLCVSNCLFCSVCGPGLALRGPDGSMHEAVDGMQTERLTTFRFFWGGVVNFFLASIFYSWCTALWYNACVVTIVVLVFLHQLRNHFMRIDFRFSLDARAMVSGRLVVGGMDVADFSLQRESDHAKAAQLSREREEREAQHHHASTTQAHAHAHAHGTYGGAGGAVAACRGGDGGGSAPALSVKGKPRIKARRLSSLASPRDLEKGKSLGIRGISKARKAVSSKRQSKASLLGGSSSSSSSSSSSTSSRPRPTSQSQRQAPADECVGDLSAGVVTHTGVYPKMRALERGHGAVDSDSDSGDDGSDAIGHRLTTTAAVADAEPASKDKDNSRLSKRLSFTSRLRRASGVAGAGAGAGEPLSREPQQQEAWAGERERAVQV